MFKKAEAKIKQQRSNLIFLDYGCGNGMLALFAKHLGYKKVICCDVDQSSIESAKLLSAAANIELDGFIHGDIDKVEEFIKEERLGVDVIIGTDVIEHIYDLEYFFSKLHSINSKQVNVFTTASNPENPFKVKQLIKLQQRDELEGGYKKHITNVEDEHEYDEPYLKVREKIIRGMNLSFREEEIKLLASITRGKNKRDIESEVTKYKIGGIVPDILEEAFNTCEPFSGSWSERILPLKKYEEYYHNAGFDLEISNGFYNSRNASVLKRLAFVPVNIFLAISKSLGRALAPFIIFTGSKRNHSKDVY